jgi:hypothetical protein
MSSIFYPWTLLFYADPIVEIILLAHFINEKSEVQRG